MHPYTSFIFKIHQLLFIVVITSVYFNLFEAVIDVTVNLLDSDLDVVCQDVPGELDDIPVSVSLRWQSSQLLQIRTELDLNLFIGFTRKHSL